MTFNTTWTCLICGTRNSTPSTEAMARCSECETWYDWWQIDLEPEHEADWEYGEVPDAITGE